MARELTVVFWCMQILSFLFFLRGREKGQKKLFLPDFISTASPSMGGVGGSSRFLPQVQGGLGGGGKSMSSRLVTSAARPWSRSRSTLSLASRPRWSTTVSCSSSSVLALLVHEDEPRRGVRLRLPEGTHVSSAEASEAALPMAARLFLRCTFSQLAWLALLLRTTARGDMEGVLGAEDWGGGSRVVAASTKKWGWGGGGIWNWRSTNSCCWSCGGCICWWCWSRLALRLWKLSDRWNFFSDLVLFMLPVVPPPPPSLERWWDFCWPPEDPAVEVGFEVVAVAEPEAVFWCCLLLLETVWATKRQGCEPLEIPRGGSNRPIELVLENDRLVLPLLEAAAAGGCACIEEDEGSLGKGGCPKESEAADAAAAAVLWWPWRLLDPVVVLERGSDRCLMEWWSCGGCCGCCW